MAPWARFDSSRADAGSDALDQEPANPLVEAEGGGVNRNLKTPEWRLEYERNRYQEKKAHILEVAAKYRSENREKLKNAAKAYRQANAERIKEKRAARYIAEKDAANARSQAYYAENKNKSKAAQIAWRAKNKERIRVIRANRDSRIKASATKLSSDLVERLLKTQRWKCACCGASLKAGYQLDHTMPLARGGEHIDSNMQLLTPLCNARKKDMHPVDWAQKNGRLL